MPHPRTFLGNEWQTLPSGSLCEEITAILKRYILLQFHNLKKYNSFQNPYCHTAWKAVGMDSEVKEVVLKTQHSSQFLGSYELKAEELWSQSTSVRSEKYNNPQKSIPEHSGTGQVVKIRYSPGYPRRTEPKNQRTCPSICNSQYSRCYLLSTSF